MTIRRGKQCSLSAARISLICISTHPVLLNFGPNRPTSNLVLKGLQDLSIYGAVYTHNGTREFIRVGGMLPASYLTGP